MRRIGIPALFLFASTVLAQSVDITACGAVADGRTLNTTAIQHAIDSIAATGGGMVVVPTGEFLTGTIHLRSNIDFHLNRGAILKGSAKLEDYKYNGRTVGLLFTQDARNVSISGDGTIDGNGDAFMVLDSAKRIDSAGAAWTRQKNNFRKVIQGVGDGPVVPRDRPYQMIIFSDCRNLTLSGVVVSNSPFWTIHCADCDGVVVHGLRIWCNLLVPNNDGIDFTSCSNVLMSDCDIRTGDDGIVVTGYDHHFDLPGYKRLTHPSENVTVTNCTIQSRSSGIRIGGFDQNPMRNYTFSNIIITNSNRGIGIFARDKGSIENMLFSNIIIETRLHTGDWWGQGEPIHVSAVRLLSDVQPGTIKNVRFEHMQCRGETGIIVYGTKEDVIDQISFDDVHVKIVESALNDVAGGNIDLRPVLEPRLQIFASATPGFLACSVRDLSLRDCSVSWDTAPHEFFTNGILIRDFDGVTLSNVHASVPPGSHERAVVLKDGRDLHTDLDENAMTQIRVER